MDTSFSVLYVAWLHPSLSSSIVNELKEKYECTECSDYGIWYKHSDNIGLSLLKS